MEDFEKDIVVCLQKGFRRAFAWKAEARELILRPTPKDFSGTHSLALFPFAKSLKKDPKEIGKCLGDYLVKHLVSVAEYTVVGGFLNLTLTDAHWIKAWQAVCRETSFGVLPKRKERVLIEYCSPNTNKPLHLGHLRNLFLGDAVAGLLEAVGYEVIRCCLYNDRGIHICKSMVSYQAHGRQETPQSTQTKGDHLVGRYYTLFEQSYNREVCHLISEGKTEKEAKEQAPMMQAARERLKEWEAGAPATRALWQKMNKWAYEGFSASYKRLNISFDRVYYESDTYALGKKMVQEGLEKGWFYKTEDGSVWVDLRAQKLDQKLLLRHDGTSVYVTQDMGTAEQKHRDFSADCSLYVLGDEQIYHTKVLFHIMRIMGKPYANSSHHISYGMVDLPTGKMKSREGTVVEADTLLDEVEEMAQKVTQALSKEEKIIHTPSLYAQLALGAIKFFLLRIQPQKRIVFHAGQSVDLQGVTGVFVQYTHARICSLLKKAGVPPEAPPLNYTVRACVKEEQMLMAHILSYPRALREGALHYDPSQLALYLYELARTYNRLYAVCPVLREEDSGKRSFRLSLSVMARKVLRQGMAILGIEVPEKM